MEKSLQQSGSYIKPIHFQFVILVSQLFTNNIMHIVRPYNILQRLLTEKPNQPFTKTALNRK